MRILFMGTPNFARIILESLYYQHEIIGLFCQPDRPFGRKQELKMPETKAFCYEVGLDIPVYQPVEFDNEVLQNIKMLNPDVIIVVAYGKILPPSVLKYRCINIHASLLPKYRGASPIQEMILHDDKFFGVSAMLMEEGLDSGDVLGFSLCKNDFCVGIEALSIKLASMGAKLINGVLERLDEIMPLKQDEIHTSYCKKIKKEAGSIDFSDAWEICRKFRAFQGWPAIFLSSGLKIFDVSLQSSDGVYQEGEILEILPDCIIVGCKKGSVKIGGLQAPNKQKVSAPQYINGKRLQIGMQLK
ncbi:methionyl-tRNA formyltransferase [Helicobacter anatolicus]|uniref:methionyl-tRNA formyltransferase n=1 Tax=Helicobacter anatolicus TaxID=2905874 RepID=UPI001E4403CA|nr:methionyl-tRNA formyltransferase [Helicobacter anatolicus]MCE3037840.1 methionyl-tRNA formyltransferase [Helicobacter anatolicus]